MVETYKEYDEGRVMWGTKAIHKLGDISSSFPDYCWVHGEDGDDYVGHWLTGFGLINVHFPKDTTTELTEEELEEYHNKEFGIRS